HVGLRVRRGDTPAVARAPPPGGGGGRPPPRRAPFGEPVEAPSLPPVETTHLFTLEAHGTTRATLALEGNGHRVDVTAVDGTDWHARLFQVFDDLQEGATYTVRFRAKADVPRRIVFYALTPDWHRIGLDEVVLLTQDWQPYQYEFQAKNLAALNAIFFILGKQTGTVWITDFTVTKSAK